jgi:hypothetical protein
VYNLIRKRAKEETKMLKPMNEAEKLVVEMLKRGEKLHGEARDIAIDMALRELEAPEKI